MRIGSLAVCIPSFFVLHILKGGVIILTGDRLWIQRVPPKAPRPKALKRKRAPDKAQAKKLDNKTSATPAKRVRLNVPPPTPSTPSGRHSRAAKDQAKLKLDMQAKELAELNRQASSSNGRPTRTTRQAATRASSAKNAPSSAHSRPLGTRASARLRGPQEEDEWQPIPDEWLNEGKRAKTQNSKAMTTRTGLESDEESISDLTELSDDGAENPTSVIQNGKSSKDAVGQMNGVETPSEEPEKAPEVPQESPDNFVEWETVSKLLGYSSQL